MSDKKYSGWRPPSFAYEIDDQWQNIFREGPDFYGGLSEIISKMVAREIKKRQGKKKLSSKL